MCLPPISWSGLLLVLVASVALAREPDSKFVIRTIKLSAHPRDATHNIYVSGQVATVLRFDRHVNPTQTRLLAWEGRFEPLLVGSKKVVIEPLRDLGHDEGVPLLVTLADGTEIPFLVRPPWLKKDEGWTPFTDHQVNVFKDPDSFNAVVSSLQDSLKRERELQDEVERYKQADSVDHALAALLAKGAMRQTSFREHQKWVLNDGDAEFVVRTFTGKGKAGVVFTIRNQNAEHAWKMKMARLYTARGWKERPFALRADSEEIPTGKSGHIAVVADKSAFVEGNQVEQLLLELYRDDGFRQVFVLLDPKLVRE
ncbi:DUF2381 family protein [Pyxidicoccus sp. 3LG]